MMAQITGCWLQQQFWSQGKEARSRLHEVIAPTNERNNDLCS